MKNRLFLMIVAFLLLPCSLLSASLSSKDVVNMVKGNYPNAKYRYSYTKVAKVIDDQGCCDIDGSVYKENEWLAQCDSLWLVFVDEKPMQGWAHACKYVYLPTDYSGTSTVPMLVIPGKLPPRNGVKLTLFGEKGEGTRSIKVSQKTKNNKRIIENSFSLSDTSVTDLKYEVAIVNCFNDIDYNYLTYYFDMKYFYEMLHKKYGINDFHIFSGVNFTYDFAGNSVNVDEEFFYFDELSKIIDDGCYGYRGYEPTKKDFTDYLKSKQEAEPVDNLIIFFSGHGYHNEKKNRYYICFPDGDMSDIELKKLLDAIPTQHQIIIMENCYSGGFIDALAAKGRVIMTACSKEEESFAMITDWPNESEYTYDKDGNLCLDVFYKHNYYNLFSHMLTSALNGERHDYDFDENGEIIEGEGIRPVASDVDSNGRISLQEAFAAANDCIRDVQKKANKMVSSGEYFPQTAQYSSSPSTLGEDFSFNHIPESSELFIRDNDLDSGKEANTITDIYWNSPDMWTSVDGNHNEKSLKGLEQLVEPILRENETLYTYVKVSNRGIYDYDGYGKYLHLMWSEPSINQTPATWLGNGKNLLGGQAAYVEIEQPIAVGESCIVKVPWTFPKSLYEKAISEQTEFNFSMLACISDAESISEAELSDTLNVKMPAVLSLRNLAQKSFTFQNVDGGDFEIGISSITKKTEASYQISFTAPAKTGASLLLTSSISPQNTISVNVKGQSENVIVDLNDMPFGPIATTLVSNGKVMDSKQFIHQSK